MLYSTLAATLAVLQVLPVIAIPTLSSGATPRREGPVPSYGIEDITWEIVTASGTTVNITGTVEQVFQYAEKKNIAFKQISDVPPPSTLDDLTKNRWDPSVHRLMCFKNDNLADLEAIERGIKYLNKIPGKPVNGPGPGNCGRVSCSWNSAIYWCNNDTEVKTLDSFRAIADGAQFVLNNCPFHPILFSGLGGWGVEGSVTMKDGWTVVVRGDHEDC
ncbi:hypothetical protein B0T20DRAFT_449583 [Sordaria brevicollis]|uniref:Uncharacterized protein n=1 Tax=Sordaria brevicollis TaxID=83679 RepID=A0AAE0PMX2_SORBR|nr:hypothetical protein B0T20DRAFT_449583 [Sordaria brevicollis]